MNRKKIEEIKDVILGKGYELSFALVSPKQSHEINKKYRDKDYPANVLSFPLSENSGEIILDKETAGPHAKDFDMKKSEFMLFLVIHAMLHLKGLDHSSTMEKEERKFLKKFSKK